MYYDLIFILAILAIPAIAQFRVSSSYSKYKKQENSLHISGQEVAEKILKNNGLDSIYVVETEGNLTDHYDPTRKVVRLSKDIFHGTSVAALSIAAHEVGHAIQDKDGYFFMRLRSFIFPIVNVATQFSYIILLIGIFLGAIDLIYLGIAFTALGLIFQIVTLPVEFDASARAKKEIEKTFNIDSKEASGVSNMLGAAAMTYVAGVLSSALNIIRLLMMIRND